jgi:hypothetical protein
MIHDFVNQMLGGGQLPKRPKLHPSLMQLFVEQSLNSHLIGDYIKAFGMGKGIDHGQPWQVLGN